METKGSRRQGPSLTTGGTECWHLHSVVVWSPAPLRGRPWQCTRLLRRSRFVLSVPLSLRNRNQRTIIAAKNSTKNTARRMSSKFEASRGKRVRVVDIIGCEGGSERIYEEQQPRGHILSSLLRCVRPTRPTSDSVRSTGPFTGPISRRHRAMNETHGRGRASLFRPNATPTAVPEVRA